MDNYALASIICLSIGIFLIIYGQDRELEGIIYGFFGLVLIIAVPIILWSGDYFSYKPAEGKWKVQKEYYGVSVSNGLDIVPIRDYETIEKFSKDSTFTVFVNKELFGKNLFKVEF
jgi:hypothetical protein